MAQGRLAREEKTVSAMIRLFCRTHHGAAEGLCAQCAALLAYARKRLARCPFGTAKPNCAKCPIHCYRPQERERIRALMRYAGPRMLLRHPVLALLHFLDSLRSPSPCRQKQNALY
ncbi:MAG: nitrous oxide-stimulated promoter family protein [Chloroflexia bacterium]